MLLDRYANDTVSGFLLTMVEALEDDDASYTASKATEADAMLDASLGGAFARTTSNVTKAIAATHRRESKLGGHARTGLVSVICFWLLRMIWIIWHCSQLTSASGFLRFGAW